jgi:UDP-glucose 4-epimerase
MRILVTGAAGFIGSHVTDAYLREGHEVCALDNLGRGRRAQVNAAAHWVHMDLRSPDLKDLLRDGRFDCVNHHAAQIDVGASIADPARDATVNILGTLNLLEAMRATASMRLIFASSGGAIYTGKPLPATEEHRVRPLSPYGVSKLSVEQYVEYYRAVHGIQHVVLRYSNVYGPRQDPEGEAGVVAVFCGRLLRGQPLVIYGDGENTRDYVFVEDVAFANQLALRRVAGEGIGPGGPDHGGLAETFNIGTGVETSVNALAALLLHTSGMRCAINYQPARTGEQRCSALDPLRAGHVLGWKPERNVRDGLAATWEWFRSYHGTHLRAESSR